MAEDTEKKFHSIMDKLFSSPKSNRSFASSSPSSAQNTRGQKRLYSAIEVPSKRDKSDDLAQAPPCRPWDRGDLMRRLATFKSMTWFAKPKAMDAVNCARRGWVNIDMDIIACEVCGARLQFSTPTSWNREQVEKAALVASLKLDAGHKLLCPWINNACDENLTLFPPMPTPVLVDHYKERSSLLLQLSALPVISPLVLERMRSPQLVHFLKQSVAVECNQGTNGSAQTEHLGNSTEDLSVDMYYQAHRVLSLCGWEPRSLPYTVDCSSDHPKQPANDADLSSTSHVASGENSNKLCVYVSSSVHPTKQNEDPLTSAVRYDPNSTILECKWCGASVGLWAFPTVPRPLELVRLVGYTETGGQNGEERRTDSDTTKKSQLSLTIAGGPPPTQQNFRARISLPVVGRNVRTRFSHELSSQSSDTSEHQQVHASPNTIEEGSNKENVPSVDVESSGTDKLSSVEDGGALNQAKSADNGSLEELEPTESAPLTKETSSVAGDDQEENGGGAPEKVALQSDGVETHPIRHFGGKSTKFDPIGQHRHFCPWVKSSGTTAPGWQQTLSALHKERVFLLPESDDSSSSPSLIKVDDPVTSIRKLFESPPSKRAKPASA